ncbi:alpha/beta fold hydrolase [Specibacter cremeus]|uniref:alpha/beta fold hydrolase n=1 Tax=Specibacter cremeus TaxID=1629051 RepID=UPI000F789A42|nr:hypothetical protein [Specibacter cremeus]
MEQAKSADGTMIAFDRSGAGAPLVLVVGAFSDRSSTKTLSDGLANRFEVYAYEPPYTTGPSSAVADELDALVIASRHNRTRSG